MMQAPAVARSSRLWPILILFSIVAVVFLGRLVYLCVIVAPEYSSQASATRTIDVDLSPRRGTIYDANGTVLATSVDATTIYCNPYEVTDVQGEAAQLAALLGGDRSDYEDALSSSNTSFAYVARKADQSAADQVKSLNLDGIYFLSDSKRVYPCGQTAGQIIGMVDVDGNGQSGLELYYDDILKGTEGHLTTERGSGDYPIAGGLHEETAAVDGQDIVLSIDVDMQEYVESRLTDCVQQLNGKSGCAIVYDASNGEIVSMASTPYLNPGDRNNVEEGATELKTISYPYEPGSIFKSVSMMSILETGSSTPDDTFDCPSSISADGYSISDAHERGDTTYTLRQILQYSSNVGMSLATEKMGFGPLYDHIQRYNLTSTTGVDYPGESAGYCSDESTWSTIQSYNVSFGQGISVTPLQITRFYGALANNGVECTPHFLIQKPQSGETPEYDTEQVIENTDAISDMTSMLQTVVSDGTGTGAQIEGFSPAGKTGTAEYVDDTGTYVSGWNNISFVGYLPDSSSELVCFVSVSEVPGDNVTTGAFKDIMTYAINRYKITSD